MLKGSKFKGVSLAVLLLMVIVASLSHFSPPSSATIVVNASEILLSQPLTVRWRYESNVTLNLTPASDNERIYLPLAGGVIVALQAKDGQLNWRSEMGGELSASPVADNSMIFVASEAVTMAGPPSQVGGALRALGREGGVTQWMTPVVRPLRGSLALNGGKLFAGGIDGRAYAFDKRTGGVLWSIPFDAPLNGHPVSAKGRVYFGSEDGTLLALEESTGKLLWRFKTAGAIHGPVAVNGNTVFFGSGDGYIYAVHADKGKSIWRKRTGAGVAAVTLTTQGILAASLDNFAYVLNPKGDVIWKRQLPGRIASKPLTVQEDALFTPLSSSTAIVLALRDGKQVNALPTGEELTSSAAPIMVGDAVLVTTERALLAFAPPPTTPLRDR